MQGEIPAGARDALADELVRNVPGTVVVTPNRRLSQALLAGVDARQVAAGHASWPAPDVLPLEALLRRLWDDVLHSEAGDGLPLVLSEVQEQALWEEAISGSRHGAELFSPAAAASQCRRAWALAHEWCIEDRLESHAAGEDARTFVDWSVRYARLARERGMTDAARLPAQLFALPRAEAARWPKRLLLYAFGPHTPRQRQVLQRLRERGCEVHEAPAPEVESRSSRRVFASPAEELAEVAGWARTRLEANPAARIGVVVPDLGRRRDAVRRALARVLQPGYQVQAPDAALPFEISLGAPLAHAPIVADALQLLRLCGHAVAFEDASALLRSPFVKASAAEAAARARLDAELRRRLGLEVTLEALARVASLDRVPHAHGWVKMLEKLAAHRRKELTRAQGAGAWARGFAEALRIAGFPGERGLDSHEYQAWEKWHDVLSAFAALERAVPAMRHGEACSRLERFARETVFQPEGQGAPVQVLGVLESAGLAFDHLWVCGLTDEAWPRPPRPHPMLPVALQRQAGIPQADAAGSLAFDRRITAGWLRAAPELVVSHARMQGDGEVGVSALVAGIGEVGRDALAIDGFVSFRERVQAAGGLERIEDGRGSPAPPVVTGAGTGLFRDQAACPFRAFAVHRLRSKPLEDIDPGLAASERGKLLHDMLQALWNRLETPARLAQLGESELEAVLSAAADEAVEKMRQRQPEAMSGRFGRLEQRRLVAMARQWLALERTREPFEVLALEHKVPVTVGGITVNARLDREDWVAGGRVVIDYKTGKKVTVASWLGPRPDDPQLPLYALARGPEVKAIAFAQVRPGSLRFCGVGTEAKLLPGVNTIDRNRTPGANAYRDWDALVAHWKREMEALAAEFLAGDARVMPKSGNKTCALCDQKPLCRVAEKAPEATLPAEAEEDA